jgi:hypothetical protein
LNDDSIARYKREHDDLRHKLGVEDEDDITYKSKAEDDDSSKHKPLIGNEDITYKGKSFDDGDDKASKHIASNYFDDSEAATLCESIMEIPKSPKWEETPFKKVLAIAICAYCTYRATVGFTIALVGLINHTTPGPAHPSYSSSSYASKSTSPIALCHGSSPYFTHLP